jgi:hypothetical protein
LGPSWIVDGEDPKLYEERLARVGAAVQPIDIIDWLFVKDIVALTWEIQRSRRQCESLIRIARRSAMEIILEVAMPRPETIRIGGHNLEIRVLASQWLNGDPKATKRVETLLRAAGFSIADVTAQSLTVNAVELDRIDQQTQRHEERRDRILQQIERRRAGWSRQVQRASEDIVDAEFQEATRGNLAGRADGAVPEDEA